MTLNLDCSGNEYRVNNVEDRQLFTKAGFYKVRLLQTFSSIIDRKFLFLFFATMPLKFAFSLVYAHVMIVISVIGMFLETFNFLTGDQIAYVAQAIEWFCGHLS